LIFALFERPHGADTSPPDAVVYDLRENAASRGGGRVDGPALVWTFDGEAPDAALAATVDVAGDWLVRCDRVDFPPGSVAHRHDHPGPGIRRLLAGALTLESEQGSRTYRAGEAWFEGAGDPVLATASKSEPTAFVRVLLLPPEWAGRRTIRYLDPADEEKPRLQRATILLEEPLAP
jgi:hypothetical protein